MFKYFEIYFIIDIIWKIVYKLIIHINNNSIFLINYSFSKFSKNMLFEME